MAKSVAKSTGKTSTKTTRQTVRVNGVRTVITTRNGKVTMKAATPKEWELQAAQVQALRALPEYGRLFLLAGDQNSAKRGPRAQIEATAAGMTPGEADMRIYLPGARIRMFENKVGNGPLSPAQKSRHAALSKLGHEVEVVRAITKEEAASKAVSLVRSWLADNDNRKITT